MYSHFYNSEAGIHLETSDILLSISLLKYGGNLTVH